MFIDFDLNDPRFDLRYTEPSDEKYLAEWLKDPEVLKWFPMSEGKELENALQVWMGFSRHRCCLTAIWDNRPVGMGILLLMPYRKVAHHCLSKLVVDPKLRNKGIGGALIKNLKHLAKEFFRIEWIQMEIFAGNSVISLFKKHNFYEMFRQEDFAKIGDQYFARIFMECDLRLVKRGWAEVKGYDIHWESQTKKVSPSQRSKEISMRPVEKGDANSLTAWLNDEAILKWFPMCDRREIEDSVRIWMSYSLIGAGLAAEWDGKVCGFSNLYIQGYKKLAHQCLFSIIVGKEWRGRGIGAQLLDSLMKVAKEKFKIELLHLEVYEGNPAIHLYQRSGFKIYGIDRHFIKEADGNYRAKIMMQQKL